ncbi:MAG: carboxypeptidase regulatory-like domain-containing protein [Phycisphaerales bacterium]|nr:carboxypeptidase regulatory-like domain-containing protein [Phycisphaerales bacterium]MCB9855929.1 carboxypeptidase regulatory-like domain-containing protein [Phycisphaerales bacterium]MCB9864090.1 carboxypeptidase regulatory-like domain-containing protein [Phycisphaerales bacterium]
MANSTAQIPYTYPSHARYRQKRIRMQRLGPPASIAISAIVFALIAVPVSQVIAPMVASISNWYSILAASSFVLVAWMAVSLAVSYVLARCTYYVCRYRTISIPVSSCDHCQYDLSNNISGKCPECGHEISTLPTEELRSTRLGRRAVRFVGIVSAFMAVVVLATLAVGWIGIRFASVIPMRPAPVTAPVGQPSLATISDSQGTITVAAATTKSSSGIRGSVQFADESSASPTAVANCVVYIRNGPATGAPANTTPFVFDLVPNGFSTMQVCIQAGQPMIVRNLDSVGRQFQSGRRRPANPPQMRALPQSGMQFTTSFAIPERDIAIFDTIYARAGTVRMHVFGHPYFTMTDSTGAFALPMLPAGTYELVCESERYGRVTGDIVVTDSSPLAIEVVYDDLR